MNNQKTFQQILELQRGSTNQVLTPSNIQQQGLGRAEDNFAESLIFGDQPVNITAEGRRRVIAEYYKRKGVDIYAWQYMHSGLPTTVIA